LKKTKSRTGPQLRSTNEYLVKIRERRDALSGHARQLSTSTTEQDKVLLYFLKRAIQIADTCFFAFALQTPLLVMSRVLCEDLFMLFWLTQSEERATEYRKVCLSQFARMARASAKKGGTKFRRKSTGEDATKEFLPKLNKFILDKNRVEQIADSCGLGLLYDIIYRFNSLEVHGFTYGIVEDEENFRATLCGIVSLLNATRFIAEHRGKTTEEDIQKILWVGDQAGKPELKVSTC
jgi:Family of unknown function (DUF5677)